MGVFNKMITSIFFVLTAFFGTLKQVDAGNSAAVKYGLAVIIGLFFGLLGDVFLDQKWVYPNDMKKYLNCGFIVFGIGHIFYCTAMSVTAGLKFKWIALGIGVGAVVTIVNALLEKPTHQNFGEFRGILTVYSLLVGCTPGFALAAFIATRETAYIILLIAGVFFLISDVILSPMYFGKDKNTPTNFVINHVTYYIAQYLIALSIIMFK